MSVKDSIKFLSFFSNLTTKQLDLIANFSSINSYNEGYVLYYEKTHWKKLIFLIEGLAKAYKTDKHQNEIFLYYIHQNSIISDISSIHSDTLSSFATISFVENSKVLSIDYIEFKKHFLDTNILTVNLIEESIKRTRNLEFLINREFIFNAFSKVAMMINSDLIMFNKLKRYDVSLMLHIQPATLSRVLNRLKRDNIIDIIQGQISVLSKEKLELLCENFEDE